MKKHSADNVRLTPIQSTLVFSFAKSLSRQWRFAKTPLSFNVCLAKKVKRALFSIQRTLQCTPSGKNKALAIRGTGFCQRATFIVHKLIFNSFSEARLVFCSLLPAGLLQCNSKFCWCHNLSFLKWVQYQQIFVSCDQKVCF